MRTAFSKLSSGPCGAYLNTSWRLSYAGLPGADWAPFAQLVLEAAYATIAEGVLNAALGRSNIVLLTRLGGGAFGNDARWIDAALLRVKKLFTSYDLDVRMVHYGWWAAHSIFGTRPFQKV